MSLALVWNSTVRFLRRSISNWHCWPVSLPSDEIEELVVVQVRKLLESPQQVLA
jgi:hypothetical protein